MKRDVLAKCDCFIDALFGHKLHLSNFFPKACDGNLILVRVVLETAVLSASFRRSKRADELSAMDHQKARLSRIND